MKHLLIIGITLVALCTHTAMAQYDDNGQGRRGHRGPPQVALDACASATEGDSCSFTGRRGEIVEGTCEIKRNDQMVCFPEGGPPHLRRRAARDE